MGTNADELRIEIEATRDDMGQTLDAIGNKVVPSRIVERRKQRFMDRSRGFKDRVMGTTRSATESVTHTVEDTANSAADTVKALPDTVKERTEGAPMVAGAIAFGAGMLVAAVIPPTRMEREKSRMVHDAVEPLKQEVAAGAKEMADHLKDPVKEAAHHVGEQMSSGVGEVKDQMSGNTV